MGTEWGNFKENAKCMFGTQIVRNYYRFPYAVCDSYRRENSVIFDRYIISMMTHIDIPLSRKFHEIITHDFSRLCLCLF